MLVHSAMRYTTRGGGGEYVPAPLMTASRSGGAGAAVVDFGRNEKVLESANAIQV